MAADRRRQAGTAAVIIAVAAALAACGSGARPAHAPATGTADATTSTTGQASPTATGTPVPAPKVSAADWPTYGHDAGRTGAAAGVPPLGWLTVAWRRPLDGAVYAQPLIIGDRVVAATEGGSLYVLDARSGKVVWRRHIADPVPLSDLPCGNIDPLGITGTPVYDQATGLVFAVAETTGGRHLLAGVSLVTSRIMIRREVEPPRGSPIATQQRPALAAYGGRVYIAFGGLDGDCADYVGSVVSVATSGQGPVDSYAVPTSRGGGIWATGGAVVAGNRLLVSVGNGASTSIYDGSDSVTALSRTLRTVDVFAPSGWAGDNASDADLGSMTPAVMGGAAAGYVFISGKSGTGYVLRAGRLGGIGGEVARLTLCAGYGTGAVAGATVYVPCEDGGVRAVTIGADGTPRAGWTARARSAQGSPVTGGGAVWVVDYQGGVLYALDPASGVIRGSAGVGRAPHFAAPALSGGRVYVGTLGGVVAVGGA